MSTTQTRKLKSWTSRAHYVNVQVTWLQHKVMHVIMDALINIKLVRKYGAPIIHVYTIIRIIAHRPSLLKKGDFQVKEIVWSRDMF